MFQRRLAACLALIGLALSGCGSTGVYSNVDNGGGSSLPDPVTVPHGGTGVTGWTTGQLLYASGATTLAGLSDVAAGQVLVSGGVGAAPSYSASPQISALGIGVAAGSAGTITGPFLSFIASNGGTELDLAGNANSDVILAAATSFVFQGQSHGTGVEVNTDAVGGLVPVSGTEALGVSANPWTNTYSKIFTFHGATSGTQSWIVPATGASGTFTLPATHGAAGAALTDTAGNGVLAWTVPSGGFTPVLGSYSYGSVTGTSGTPVAFTAVSDPGGWLSGGNTFTLPAGTYEVAFYTQSAAQNNSSTNVYLYGGGHVLLQVYIQYDNTGKVTSDYSYGGTFTTTGETLTLVNGSSGSASFNDGLTTAAGAVGLTILRIH